MALVQVTPKKRELDPAEKNPWWPGRDPATTPARRPRRLGAQWLGWTAPWHFRERIDEYYMHALRGAD